MTRPDGLDGGVVLTGAARDLHTSTAQATPIVLDEVSLRGRVAFHQGRTVLELGSSPEQPRLAELIGFSAASGFRREAERVLPEHSEARSPLYLLVDDVPVGVLVSGFAMHRDGTTPLRSVATGNPPKPDLCAGWQRGGTMMRGVEATGRTPHPQGATAPPEEPVDDPYAWHPLTASGARGVRRRRRLDLTARDVLEVEAVFRDSYFPPEGGETVIHEYGLTGTIEPGSLRILTLEASAHVLPWLECPQAAASAGHLVGHTVEDLRRHVRAELVGISTCTHLNDMLRSLEDVIALAPLVCDRRGGVRS